MEDLKEPVALSGGELDGPVEGQDWPAGTEMEFEWQGRVHTYRRLGVDPDTGDCPRQAVFCGSRLAKT